MIFGGEGRDVAGLGGARDPRQCLAVVGAQGFTCNGQFAVELGSNLYPTESCRR
jgi:hypothetical protein